MKKIISFTLCASMALSFFAIPTEAATEDVQLIKNAGFEETDGVGFPKGWDSNGKNLLLGGDFETGENALKSVGKSPTGYTLKWNRPNANDGDIAIVESSADEKAEFGEYYSRLTFKTAKWNAVGYSNAGNATDHYLINAAYGGEYIMRADYKVSSVVAFPNKKMQGYMFYAVAEEDKDSAKRKKNETYFEPQVIDGTSQPSTGWQQMTTKITLIEKPTDGKYTYYDIPHIQRLQFRYIDAPVLGSYSSDVYFDNMRVEKAGRVSDENAAVGNKSLKIVGYADTEDEIWISDEAEVVSGEKIRASLKVMPKVLESYEVNTESYVGKIKAVAVFDGTKEIEIGSVSESGSEFVTLSKEITVPTAAKKMSVKVVFTGKGTAYIDDVRAVAKRTAQDVSFDGYENKLSNPGFESVDKYSFPDGWNSDGKNLVPNGDFESGKLDAGKNLTDTVNVKYIRVGNVTGISLVNNKNENEEVGNHSLKITWGDTLKWGGTEIKDYEGLIPLSYSSKYILRAMAKSADDKYFTSSSHKFQFNVVTNDKKLNSNNEINYYDRVLSKNEWIAKTEWQEFSGEWTAIAKSDALDPSLPLLAVRYQIRAASPAVKNAELYVDNFRMEKLGRADSANANSGKNSLKILAYDDGVDEVWTSDRVALEGNGEIAIGAALKTQNVSEGVKIAVNFYQGNDYSDSFTLTEYATASAWSELRKITTIPEGADSAEIVITLPDASGNVWIDDVFLGEHAKGVSIKAVECDKADIKECAGEELLVSAKLYNGTALDASALVASVLYDKDYNIIALDIKNAILSKERDTVVTSTIKIPKNADLTEYKLETVVWDNKDNVLPLCDRFVISE